MMKQLKIKSGFATDAGRKAINQDCLGVNYPEADVVNNKGIAVAIADGISSSKVSQEASQAAVTGFLEDYFCTSDAWSVKKSGMKVLSALNSWLFSQTQNSAGRFDKDKGHVCTFSSMVLKSNSAHIFHCGDSRIYRIHDNHMEQLTTDHRTVISPDESYLARALGVAQQLDFDYQNLAINEGDVFVLTTDGIYEFVSEKFMKEQIHKYREDLDEAASVILKEAYDNKSDDNLSIQIVKVSQLPDLNIEEISQQVLNLPIAPKLSARMEFDGYYIQREIYISSRSHVFLAQDLETKQQFVLKTPSTELCNDDAYLESFLTEDWIAKRVNNAHVLKTPNNLRPKKYMYLVSEYIEGQSLSQWMTDNPNPSIEKVRDIVSQVAKGLQAFHRQEMVHQDLRPNNIMIDKNGLVKIIDFGSTKVAGILETKNISQDNRILGTALYSAPEYFIGYGGDNRSDLFSLAAITYQMLSGKLPYDTKVSHCKTKKDLYKLQYQSLMIHENCNVPAWVDGAIRKATKPEPLKRYQEVSEFIYDLHHPNKEFSTTIKPALIEKNPVAFWQGVSACLFMVIIFLVAKG